VYLLAAAVAEATATQAPTDWVSILLSAGVAGAVLAYLFVKFIPDMKAEHALERAQLRSDNERQETKQRSDFLGAFEKGEERAERREAAMNEQLLAERESREKFVGEATAMGNRQATATLRMSDSMDRFSEKLDTLPERIRRSTRREAATTDEDLKAAGKKLAAVDGEDRL
jgi:predicted ATPase